MTTAFYPVSQSSMQQQQQQHYPPLYQPKKVVTFNENYNNYRNLSPAVSASSRGGVGGSLFASPVITASSVAAAAAGGGGGGGGGGFGMDRQYSQFPSPSYGGGMGGHDLLTSPVPSYGQHPSLGYGGHPIQSQSTFSTSSYTGVGGLSSPAPFSGTAGPFRQHQQQPAYAWSRTVPQQQQLMTQQQPTSQYHMLPSRGMDTAFSLPMDKYFKSAAREEEEDVLHLDDRRIGAASASPALDQPPAQSLEETGPSSTIFTSMSIGRTSSVQQQQESESGPTDAFTPGGPRSQSLHAGHYPWSTAATPATAGASMLGLKSPTQMDPHFDTGLNSFNAALLSSSANATAGHWVTVYGFPPTEASYILKKFAIYGEILDHKKTGHGNWMHIMFRKRLQAQKALSKNGKIFDDKMMIGVVECIDAEVIGSHKVAIPTAPIFTPSATRSTGLVPSRKRKYKSVFDTEEEKIERDGSFFGGVQQPPAKKKLPSSMSAQEPQPQRGWLSYLSDVLFRF